MIMLTLDLSTTCTGWAVFDLKTKKPIDYGFLKPNKKGGIAKLTYPERQLLVMKDLASQIMSLVYKYDGFSIDNPKKLIKLILVEEVNLHKSRMTGKTLDGLHWILMNEFNNDRDLGLIKRVAFRDSDGEIGWRTRLNLRLSEMDKKINAEHKKLNKKSKVKLPIITKKHLACRYVNSVLGTSFDVEQNESDGDVADALGLGLSELLTLK